MNNLSVRELAFLEHEMEQIKNDSSRPGEDRELASGILGCAQAEIEWEEEQQMNDMPNPM